jgi:integrase
VRATGIVAATPHDLRRSYITDLLNRDVDPLTVAGLAGHARIETTRKYDRRPHATRVAAVATLGDDY